MKKLISLIWLSCFACLGMHAQVQNDPVLLTIENKPVSRSEFEYIYNKNRTQSGSEALSLDEYLKLFVNFKLKVALAEELGLDTTSIFRTEYLGYYSQVAANYLNDEQADEQYARQQYDSLLRTGEWARVQLSYIFKHVAVDASEAENRLSMQRIDSIYNALNAGADFATLARQHSDDRQTAQNGGSIGWVERHRAVPQFEQVAFALSNGKYSEPFSLSNGYCIILKHAEDVVPFETAKKTILEARAKKGLLSAGKAATANRLRSEYNLTGSDLEVLEWGERNLERINLDFAHLMREYRDGILLFEVSKMYVWDKAGEDVAGLTKYFNEHKKKYSWDEPRFKGIAVHTRDKKTLKSVKALLKKTDFSQWSERVRNEFNTNDSIAVRAQIGLFTKGINMYVDAAKFKGAKQEPMKDFPYSEVIGKMLKKEPEVYTDVRGAITADYQSHLEEQWIEDLQTRFPVVIDRDVLNTVNNH